MSGKFFSKFDSEYFSFFIFLKYLLLLLLIMIYVPKMTLLEKSKICRTFRAVGHLGTLHTGIYQKTSNTKPRIYAVPECLLEVDAPFFITLNYKKKINYGIRNPKGD